MQCVAWAGSIQNETNRLKNHLGYSLVELMVTVAIMGVLATICTPVYNAMIVKARQGEGKADLTALYAAEKVLHAQWQTYTTSFVVMNLKLSGNYFYSFGFKHGSQFATTTKNGLPADYTGAQGSNADSNSTWYCTSIAPDQCTCVAPSCAGKFANGHKVNTADTFLASANSVIFDANYVDTWTIDQNKILLNTAVGQ